MTQWIESFQTHDTLQSVARFCVVGLLSTLIDITLFSALHLGLGIPALLANTISYSAGIINSYSFNRSWAFARRQQKPAAAQFAQFAAASLSALALNNLLVLALAPPLAALLASSAVGALAAKVSATGVGFIWNYLSSHFWVFRSQKVSEIHED